MIKKIAAGIAVAGALIMAAGCSHVQPSVAEDAITTSHGSLSNQKVVNVTCTGNSSKTGSGTTSWYFPANVRNYVTGPQGDRPQSTAAFTNSGGSGDPAISTYVETYVGWEVNPAICSKKNHYAFASHFLQFCLKYGCASNDAQNNEANASKNRSSDTGWLKMVDEIFPRAVDNATRSAMVSEKPTIWESSGQAQWPVLGDKIAGNLSTELQTLDGSKAEGQPDYFCGPGSTLTKCKPFLVQINGVTPTDQGIIQAYQQQQQANFSQQAAAARLHLAQTLYGKDAGWFLGMFDLTQKCHTCTIYAGNAPFHP